MYYHDFVDAVATKCGYKKSVAEMLVKDFIGVLIDILSSGESVSFRGFGAFTIREVSERESVSYQGNARITIPAHKRLHFSVGKAIDRAIKQNVHIDSTLDEDQRRQRRAFCIQQQEPTKPKESKPKDNKLQDNEKLLSRLETAEQTIKRLQDQVEVLGLFESLPTSESHFDIPELLSVKDLQSIFKISLGRAYALAASDGFPTITIGKSTRIPTNMLEKWCRDNVGKVIDVDNNDKSISFDQYFAALSGAKSAEQCEVDYD